MLIFDQLKKNDPQLQLLSAAVLSGLLVLLTGLWWIQIVSGRDYQEHLETQSFRTVRIPAVRGRILDRNGQVLAENRASYNACLYLEELRRPFDAAYSNELVSLRASRNQLLAQEQNKLNGSLAAEVKKRFGISAEERNRLRNLASSEVAKTMAAQISLRLQEPLAWDDANFLRHYSNSLALPYPVLKNLDSNRIARFEEQCNGMPGVDLVAQSTRVYPHGTTAAHVLGYLRRDDSSIEGEDAFFTYRLPDFRGVVGIEGAFDQQLHGRAGAESVLVNSRGFRQTEDVWSPAEPGRTVVLTLDLRIQLAAERALRNRVGQQVRGAVVVMNVTNGDLLAVVSAPAFDPNEFIPQISRVDYDRLTDPATRPQINRATQENYAPGSIFKTVIGLACLEAGLDPKKTISLPGYIRVRGHYVHDLAGPGDFDFRRALVKSSNAYFITNGLIAGAENIVRLGQRLHLGENTGLPTRQDASGMFPTLQQIHSGWSDISTANMCIGQDPVKVTPLQMAVLAAAIANGGKVLRPRLVDRIQPADPNSGEPTEVLPYPRLRDELGVKPRNLEILRQAMLADTEDPEGTAYAAFHEHDRATPALTRLRVCGKTGTAQVMNERNQVVDHNTWFLSFAPYEQPRYAVVVLVESGGSGGGTCAPIGRDIYAAIEKLEGASQTKSLAQIP